MDHENRHTPRSVRAEYRPLQPDADGEAAKPQQSQWIWLRDLYLSFDRRTLAFTRILLGVFLLFDLFRRTPDWLWLFSDKGVLPVTHNLWRPQSSGWSLFNAFHTSGELWVLWGVGFVIFTMLLLGYKTRVVQVLAAIYIASANGRVLLVENGGYVVQNLLLLWTAFLPLGDRFSIDALQRSWRHSEHNASDLNEDDNRVSARMRAPHVSLLGAALILQIGALYFFNVVHKTGPAWANNTAVHYVLYNDRMATPLIAAVRDHLPNALIFFLSKLSMILEASIPFCLMSPLARVWSRRFVVVAMFLLHVGFGSSFVLGPFAWSLCVFASLFINAEDWDLLARVMRRSKRALTIHYNPTSQAAFWVCRLLRRADWLRLVHFRASDDIATLAVEQQRQRIEGGEAVTAVVDAMPLGPLARIALGLPFTAKLWLGLGRTGLRLAGVSGTRSDAEHTAPAARRGGDKPIDFASHWIARSNISAIMGLLIGGAWLAIFGGPMLHRVKSGLHKVVVGSVALEDITLWLGVALALVGAAAFIRSLLTTAWTLTAEGQRRVLRFGAVVREVLVVVMLAGAINQALVELWVAKRMKVPQPPAMQLLAHKFRYLQGWFMFSPNPVMDDGIIVVDAMTVDGRHVDPFSIHYAEKTLRAPDFDLPHAHSLKYNQIWSDYFNRMHLPGNRVHRKPMEAFIYRLPERTGNPRDAIVSGDVYWVHDLNPKWNTTQSYALKKDKLFSFTNPNPPSHHQARP